MDPKRLWIVNFGRNGKRRKPGQTDELKQIQAGLKDIDRALKNLALEMDGHEMSAETASLFEGLGSYIKPDGLWQTLMRRGSSHRLLVPLADRALEELGWAKLHLNNAALQADLVPMISYKILSISVRLDKIQQVLESTSVETQELMAEVLKAHRKRLIQISQNLMENFGAHADNRLLGSPGS
jgi:hypothetical protein